MTGWVALLACAGGACRLAMNNKQESSRHLMRIEQNSAHLVDLVKCVRSGRVVPAAFQRPYVWDKSDVIALCESVLAGYPIGGFLSWIPREGLNLEKVGRRRIGPLECASPEQGVALLLDGQNRLATIAWMMLEDGATLPNDMSVAERQTWGSDEHLVVDLARRRLAFIDQAFPTDGFFAPAWTVFGGAAASMRIRELWNGPWQKLPSADVESGVRWLDLAQDAFRGARVTETLLDRASVEEARAAFLHICRVGKPMTDRDFEDAVQWVYPSGRDGKQAVEDAAS